MSNSQTYGWHDIEWLLDDICDDMEEAEFRPDIIVPIVRGGTIPGVILSHQLGVPVQCVHWQTRDGTSPDDLSGNESNAWLPELALKGKNILLFDDIVDTGKTILEIKADWQASVRDPLPWGTNIKVATLFQRYSSNYNADFKGDAILNDDWVVFPWEGDYA